MSIEGRIKHLRSMHEDLEKEIEQEDARPAPDTLKIADFKKRKLQIKEELGGLEKGLA